MARDLGSPTFVFPVYLYSRASMYLDEKVELSVF